MPEPSLPDAALIDAMIGGDESALGALIDRYTAYVWAIVWNITADRLDPADARAVVSDVFYTLWRSAPDARPRNLKGYLARIARSRAIDEVRRRRPALPLEDDILALPVEGPETEALRRAEYEALRRAVDALPEPDRTIFLRHYYCCQTLAEVAAALDMNVNTVKTKLRRGRELLRRELEKGGYFIG